MMRRDPKPYWISLTAWALHCVCFSIRPAFAEGPYLDYADFRALVALAPEIRGAHLVGTTDAGMDLWAKGQMRVPSITHYVEGDFDSDGAPEAALHFESGSRRYVVIH